MFVRFSLSGLQVCLSTYDPLLPPGIEGLKGLVQYWVSCQISLQMKDQKLPLGIID